MVVGETPLTRAKLVAPFSIIPNEIGAPTVPLLSKFHLPRHADEKPGERII
jgi:hypothetical protein